MSKEENKKEKSKKEDDELGEVSYTYWKRDSDIKADHKGFQPQKTSTPVNINQNNIMLGVLGTKRGHGRKKL